MTWKPGSANSSSQAPSASLLDLPVPVWIGSAVALLANSADTFVLFLLLWVAGPQGWSGPQTALVVLALRLPTLASGVLVGRAVDRWGSRPLMLLDLAARAALLMLLLLLAASSGTEELPLPGVLILGSLAGALSPATYAAIRTLVPRLVPRPQLVRANAVVAVSDQMPLLLGTVLLGPALALLGTTGSLLVPVGMLLLALVLTGTLPAGDAQRARVTPGRAAGPVAASPSESKARVVAVMALSTAYYFVYGPFETASPVYVREQLDGSEGIYSLLWALFGVGALASLPLAPHLSRWRPGVVNALGAAAWGLVMLPLAVVESAPLAVVLFLIGGLLWGPYTTIETSALQRWVPAHRHGAVFGLQRSLLTTATPLGAALGAITLETLSPALVIALSAVACTMAGVIALTNRDLRSAK